MPVGSVMSKGVIMATNNRFSDLLWMPHSQHKVSKICENPNISMNMRHHRVGIPYHTFCRTALENLGFYQIAKMKKINIDKYLISALVERWRHETNSFHLPLGEMTITLQDVSCLLGLPIHGRPIVGRADGPWADLIDRLLGIPIEEQDMKQKKRRSDDDNTALRHSQYSLSLGKLCDRFQPTEYNWGAAALALLYRQLSNGAMKERLEISGPLLLLQLWSWSRLPLGRPENIPEKRKEGDEPEEEEEGTELDYCPVFGAKWCAIHEFRVPHNAGTQYYGNQIDLIREGTVDWQPYDDLLVKMPIQVHNDREWWFARAPIIHFWIVEFHYPDRVMRQFGRRQAIPPNPPRGENEIRKLHKIRHTGGKARQWETIHATYIEEYYDVRARMVQEDRPFDLACLSEYRCWFQQNGMYTVFFDSRCLGGLDKPIPYPRDSMEWTRYMPSGSPLARIGLREIKNAAWGIKCAVTKRCRKIGKSVLRSCEGNLMDLNLEPRLQHMLTEAGLPMKIEDIPSDDDDVSAIAHAPSPPKYTISDAYDDWIYSNRGFGRYLHEMGGGVSATQDAGQVTQETVYGHIILDRDNTPMFEPRSSAQVVDWTGTRVSLIRRAV